MKSSWCLRGNPSYWAALQLYLGMPSLNKAKIDSPFLGERRRLLLALSGGLKRYSGSSRDFSASIMKRATSALTDWRARSALCPRCSASSPAHSHRVQSPINE